jgi:hypothetical protein
LTISQVESSRKTLSTIIPVLPNTVATYLHTYPIHSHELGIFDSSDDGYASLPSIQLQQQDLATSWNSIPAFTSTVSSSQLDEAPRGYTGGALESSVESAGGPQSATIMRPYGVALAESADVNGSSPAWSGRSEGSGSGGSQSSSPETWATANLPLDNLRPYVFQFSNLLRNSNGVV